MPLTRHHYGAHPVASLISGIRSGRLKDRSGLDDRWRLTRCNSLQFIPANAIARCGAVSSAGIIDAHILAGPQPPVADVHGEQSIIQSVEIASRTAGVPKMRHVNR